MRLSDVSIGNPVFAWLLMAGLLVFGGFCYSLMGVSQMPDVDFPVITVTITWPGASPDVMEQAVADIVEDAVMSVDGIQLVQSISQEGQTQIIISFLLNQDINAALEEVQTNISAAAKNLPQTINPPTITKTNPNDQPIIWTAVYGKGATLRDLALFVRDHLKDTLTTINGVGNINLGGYVDPQMRIWLHNDRMIKNDIDFQDVINAVNNEHQLAPTGYQDDGPKETYVRVQSQFRNAQECNNLYIPTRQAGLPVYQGRVQIKDVAKCVEGTDEIRRISRFNGIEPTIGLGVIKQHGTNAVSIARQVRNRVATLGEQLPSGMSMGVVTDTTVFITQAVNELLFTLGLAILLTSIVCYLFLGTFNAAVNVIIAIPVSLVGSFIFLYFLGFTVNTFTLMGLSLSIGIVVDDAIMVLENISRHLEDGLNRVQAAIIGAREITTPAIAASLAILAIFVPVIFMRGIVGKFFFQFGVTLSCAVMLSLLEALTLAPMRCSQFLTVGGGNRITLGVDAQLKRLAILYRKALEFCLQRRLTVIGIASILFFISLFSIHFLRTEFIPPQDQSRFLLTLYTPMGSSIDHTNRVFHKVEDFYRTRPEIENFYIAVGGFGGGLVNQGISFVTMKDPPKRPIVPPFKKRPTQQEFMAFLRTELAKIPDIQRLAILDLSLTGFSAQRGYPIEFELQGPDWNKLAQYSVEIRKRLESSHLMVDIDTDFNPNMPETEILPKRAYAAKMGIPTTTIAEGISAMVGGLLLLPNKYTDSSGHRDDIQVKLVANENLDPADIEKIKIRNVFGWLTPMSDIVNIEPGNTLLTITRYNRERGIGIFGNFASDKSQSDVMAFIQKAGKEILPAGYHLTMSGSSQAFTESFNSLVLALVLGVFVAYMVLGSQFKSFLHPAIILLALPFSVTGALLAMWITDTSVNIYSLIGILLLMGIVKKNSILLVDFTNSRRREKNMSVHDALLEACPIRLRPILMTSVATIAGAIPEAAAIGPGAEVIRPMAIAVIGGVLVSSCLTLFVVPCAYSYFSRWEGRKQEEAIRSAFKTVDHIPAKSA